MKKQFILTSLCFHVIILSVFSMMPQLFGGKTPQKPLIEAVFVNLNELIPSPPPPKEYAMPSGGSPPETKQDISKSQEDVKPVSLPKPEPEKPQKAAKKKPVLPKPEIPVKKTEIQPDLQTSPDPVSVANTSEMALPVKTSDSVSSEQETGTGDASGTGVTGESGKGVGKGSDTGTGSGSFPSELRMEEVEQIPKIIIKTEPSYPYSARRRNIEGKVVVKFLVSASGDVIKPSVVSAEPEGVFEESVLKAISRWKFKPGIYQGKAVATWMILPVQFKLSG